jgi:hypothetical protein
VHYWNSGWKLRFARPVGDHLVAATLFDGVVIQPRMVDSAFTSEKSVKPDSSTTLSTAVAATASATHSQQ